MELVRWGILPYVLICKKCFLPLSMLAMRWLYYVEVLLSIINLWNSITHKIILSCVDFFFFSHSDYHVVVFLNLLTRCFTFINLHLHSRVVHWTCWVMASNPTTVTLSLPTFATIVENFCHYIYQGYRPVVSFSCHVLFWLGYQGKAYFFGDLSSSYPLTFDCLVLVWRFCVFVWLWFYMGFVYFFVLKSQSCCQLDYIWR